MTYLEAEKFLLSRELFGWKLGLERMREFLAALGNPHTQFTSVHVAGTNGKGSVTAMTASIVQMSGLKTGRYTSPHLIDLRERIRINNDLIPEDAICRWVGQYQGLVKKLECTFFETLTGLAFWYFADQKIDLAVIEVGLGGRLDATNVITPALSVITNLSYDHTDHLGTTMTAIAGEKAGILKPKVPCIIGKLPEEGLKVVTDRCRQLSIPLASARNRVRVYDLKMAAEGTRFTAQTKRKHYTDLFLPLPGPHQIANACIAITVCEFLFDAGFCVGVPPIREGLATVSWPGRFSSVPGNRQIIFDVAHNKGGVEKLTWMLRRFFRSAKVRLVIGLLKDKAIEAIIRILPKDVETIYVVPAPTHRTLPASELAALMKNEGLPVIICDTLEQGVEMALTDADESNVICITGSHYVVGKAMCGIKGLTK